VLIIQSVDAVGQTCDVPKSFTFGNFCVT